MNLSRILIISAFCAVLSCAVFLPHAESGLVANELVKQGKRHLDKGDTEKAIHELSKAYMLDPDNEETIKYLNMLGLEEGIYGRQKTSIGQAKEFGRKLNTYKSRVNELETLNAAQAAEREILEEDREYLQQAVFSKETENEILRDDMYDVRKESSEQAKRDAGLLKDIQKDNERKAKELLRLNDRIYDLKDDMVVKLNALDDRDRQIDELLRDMKSKNYEWQNQALDYQKEINALEDNFGRLKTGAEMREGKRLDQLKALRAALREDRRKLAIAKNRVILDQYRMADRDKKIIDKNKEILKLRATLTDLESKLSGVETGLWDRLSTVEDSAGPDAGEQTKELMRKDREIAGLKDQLVRARREIESLEQGDPPGQEERIVILKEELAAVKSRLDAAEGRIVVKEEENKLLQARFDDTRQRLSVVEKIMREKETEINELEDQLTDALGDLGDITLPDENPAP